VATCCKEGVQREAFIRGHPRSGGRRELWIRPRWVVAEADRAQVRSERSARLTRATRGACADGRGALSNAAIAQRLFVTGESGWWSKQAASFSAVVLQPRTTKPPGPRGARLPARKIKGARGWILSCEGSPTPPTVHARCRGLALTARRASRQRAGARGRHFCGSPLLLAAAAPRGRRRLITVDHHQGSAEEKLSGLGYHDTTMDGPVTGRRDTCSTQGRRCATGRGRGRRSFVVGRSVRRGRGVRPIAGMVIARREHRRRGHHSDYER